MAIGTIAALIGASLLGTLLSTGIQAGTNYGLQKDSQGRASLENDLARQFQSEQNALSRNWSSNENYKARSFQNYLRSTAYQTQVKDMQQAGLNPALLSGAGALYSGGASGTAASTSASGVALAGSNPNKVSASSLLSNAAEAALFKTVLDNPKVISKNIEKNLISYDDVIDLTELQ